MYEVRVLSRIASFVPPSLPFSPRTADVQCNFVKLSHARPRPRAAPISRISIECINDMMKIQRSVNGGSIVPSSPPAPPRKRDRRRGSRVAKVARRNGVLYCSDRCRSAGDCTSILIYTLGTQLIYCLLRFSFLLFYYFLFCFPSLREDTQCDITCVIIHADVVQKEEKKKFTKIKAHVRSFGFSFPFLSSLSFPFVLRSG